jgi:hypothetical protein
VSRIFLSFCPRRQELDDEWMASGVDSTISFAGLLGGSDIGIPGGGDLHQSLNGAVIPQFELSHGVSAI